MAAPWREGFPSGRRVDWRAGELVHPDRGARARQCLENLIAGIVNADEVAVAIINWPLLRSGRSTRKASLISSDRPR